MYMDECPRIYSCVYDMHYNCQRVREVCGYGVFVSQCVAVYCSVLQCVAVCCSVLQCVAVCCSVLQRVAACCSVCVAHVYINICTHTHMYTYIHTHVYTY